MTEKEHRIEQEKWLKRFVEESCTLGEDSATSTELLEKWTQWHRASGCPSIYTFRHDATFFQLLLKYFPTIRARRVTLQGNRVRVYDGIAPYSFRGYSRIAP